MKLRVLELFSGIGGMHYALGECACGDVVTAVDINNVANAVYSTNFPNTKLLEKNIESLSSDEINKMEINMILMSPPCQPFTRNGLQKDTADNRTSPFIHILNILPALSASLKYVLLENVKGFEKSRARDKFVGTLQESGFTFQEFLLSPTQFHIPNSRTRYYLIAKRKPLNFVFNVKPLVEDISDILEGHKTVLYSKFGINSQYIDLMAQEECDEPNKYETPCFSLSQILEKRNSDTCFSDFKLPDTVLMKYATVLDIVFPFSKHSCCFTKAYGSYVVGTGSILSGESADYISNTIRKLKSQDYDPHQKLNLLYSMKLRYFTPLEISRLMCFPACFKFPSSVSRRQRYRLLGNSINVHVVSVLLALLVTEGINTC